MDYVHTPLETPFSTIESGKSRIGAKAKLRQPSQQEGAKKANSPQFKHISGGSWTGSRKSPVASIRLSPDSTVWAYGDCGTARISGNPGV